MPLNDPKRPPHLQLIARQVRRAIGNQCAVGEHRKALVEGTIDLFRSLRPRDSVDAMLVALAIGLHNQTIAEIVRSALVDHALQAGLRLRLDEMKERLERLTLREAKKRELALEAMTDAGLNRIEAPDFTITARSGNPSLVVTAESDIPPAYWQPQPPKLDRQRLLSALKSGAMVGGAELSNPKSVLSVRIR